MGVLIEFKNNTALVGCTFCCCCNIFVNTFIFFLLFYLQSKIFRLELDSYGVFLGIISPGLAAYCVVLISWYVAPAYKNTTALIIYLLFVFIAGASFAFEIMATVELWRFTNIIAQIAAGAYALWQIKKYEIKLERKEISKN